MLKSVRERETVVDHVLGAVAAAPVLDVPRVHAVAGPVFPPAVFARFSALMPDAAHFEPVTPPRRASRPTSARHSRFGLTRPDLDTLPADENRFWASLSATLADPRLPATFVDCLVASARRSWWSVPRPAPPVVEPAETPPTAVRIALERAGAGGRISLSAGPDGEAGIVAVVALGGGTKSTRFRTQIAGTRAPLAGSRWQEGPVLAENEALLLAVPAAGRGAGPLVQIIEESGGGAAGRPVVLLSASYHWDETTRRSAAPVHEQVSGEVREESSV